MHNEAKLVIVFKNINSKEMLTSTDRIKHNIGYMNMKAKIMRKMKQTTSTISFKKMY